MKFAISIVGSPENPHSQVFREVAETIHYGLLALGYDSVITPELHIRGRIHIILGVCFIRPEDKERLSPHTILYNLEQVYQDSPMITSTHLELFKRYPLWDYSQLNITRLNEWGYSHVQHLPIGYTPQLTRINVSEHEDIDVLFYGSINERRYRIISELRSRGVNTKVVFGCYGMERDRLISRSKITLNIHAHEAKLFEIVRVSFLLANCRFVISEKGAEIQEENNFEGGLVLTDYESLVQACIDSLADHKGRRETAEVGFEIMESRQITQYLPAALEPVLNQYGPELSGVRDPSPIKVDLACGARKPSGYIGVDICALPEVDIVANLNKGFPFASNSVAKLRAYDALEYLISRIHSMNEIWRICQPNAEVDIWVPSTDGRGAFQDPTHVSYWNINSFWYYCIEYPSYIDLCRSYGFYGAFSIVALEATHSQDNAYVRALLRAVKTDNSMGVFEWV